MFVGASLMDDSDISLLTEYNATNKNDRTLFGSFVDNLLFGVSMHKKAIK
jgi:hypothetical protein